MHGVQGTLRQQPHLLGLHRAQGKHLPAASLLACVEVFLAAWIVLSAGTCKEPNGSSPHVSHCLSMFSMLTPLVSGSMKAMMAVMGI